MEIFEEEIDEDNEDYYIAPRQKAVEEEDWEGPQVVKNYGFYVYQTKYGKVITTLDLTDKYNLIFNAYSLEEAIDYCLENGDSWFMTLELRPIAIELDPSLDDDELYIDL